MEVKFEVNFMRSFGRGFGTSGKLKECTEIIKWCSKWWKELEIGVECHENNRRLEGNEEERSRKVVTIQNTEKRQRI